MNKILIRLAALLLGVGALGAGSPVLAQQGVDRAATRGPSGSELRELASILGEAHAIRSLCLGENDQTWRAYMLELLDLEAGSPPDRSALVRAFNEGYKSQRASHGECNSRTLAVEVEIAARGRALAEGAARKYLQ